MCGLRNLTHRKRPSYMSVHDWREYVDQWLLKKLVETTDDHALIVDNSGLILDHIKPIALGGAEFDRANLQILCASCNKAKTSSDIAEIARTQRAERLRAAGQQSLEVAR